MDGSGSKLAGAPFLRLLFPLCLGVYVPCVIGDSKPLTILIPFLVLSFILIIFRKGTFYSQPFWGLSLFLILFFFGQERMRSKTMIFPVLDKHRYYVVLDEYPEEKEKTIRVVGQLINLEPKVLVYLPKSFKAINAKPGDIFSFVGSPQLVVNDGNPFEFDYRRYLNSRGIGYRIFLKENQYCFIPGAEQVDIFRRALIYRAKLMDCLDRSGIKSANVHLIGSISFGAREEVDKETIQSFTNTGVIHVLAVSGMNVGLVYIILDFLFRFMKVRRAGHFLHSMIILAGIWSYTLITGMSPSILRAAIMFSFVLLGTTLQRSSGIFNSLAVSAFLLISWDPSIIRDVGFQLSYAAVLSIVVIQPFIYKQLKFKNLLPDKIWLLISVTLAAQIGTIPLTLHYFHQFPVYFLLANMVVIPLVTLILYLSFVVVFLSLISGSLASLVGMVLDWSVDLVLFTVNSVGAFPHSVLKGLYPSSFQLFLVFLIAIFFFHYIKTRKTMLLLTVLGLTVFLAVSAGIASYYRQSRAEIVFFNIPGSKALALTRGREAIVLYDGTLNAKEKIDYCMKPYIGGRGIRKVEMYSLSDSLRIGSRDLFIVGNFVFYKGIKLYIQPSYQKDQRKVDSILTTDLAWLSNPKLHQNDGVMVPESKIILVGKPDNPEMFQRKFPEQKILTMNKAVLLSFGSSRTHDAEGMVCNYFNQQE